MRHVAVTEEQDNTFTFERKLVSGTKCKATGLLTKMVMNWI